MEIVMRTELLQIVLLETLIITKVAIFVVLLSVFTYALVVLFSYLLGRNMTRLDPVGSRIHKALVGYRKMTTHRSDKGK